MVQISLADLGPGKWAKMVMVKGIDLPLVAPLEKKCTARWKKY
jgi:hypothetical protein